MEWLWREHLLDMVWVSDQDVQLLQEEVTWRSESAIVSDLTSFSPAVWIFLPQSCFHKFLHHYWLFSEGVVTHVGMVETDVALASSHVVRVGIAVP